MLSDEMRRELVGKINFGDIDGYGDPNLDKYFLDDGYWGKITGDKYFFVAGRKGTGKSAIYRMIEESGIKNGVIVHNTDFGEFPFQKLLELSDDDFLKPNQYQSIWKYMILLDFAQQITRYPVEGDLDNQWYKEISVFVNKYVEQSPSDFYKEVVSQTQKGEFGIIPDFLKLGVSSEQNSTFNLAHCKNISGFNTRLLEILLQYFMTCSSERRVIIQFDRLDDNYNSLQNTKDYLCLIASLLKFTYSFDSVLRRQNVNTAKVIVYLRNDIFREISKIDAESARWEQFTYFIDWTVENTHHYHASELYAMINKRIEGSDLSIQFDELFDERAINLTDRSGNTVSVFRYILDRTMHRPRDVVQFCIKIQEEVKNTGRLFFRTIKTAERDFCTWLVYEELFNEINPLIDNIDDLYQLLREMGRSSFSLSEFHTKMKDFCQNQRRSMTTEQLAKILYETGIIHNINMSKTGELKRRNSFRNAGPLDKNMKLIIHRGVWSGITD